jgi:tetratricopeptide (TPR) repeat protein
MPVPRLDVQGALPTDCARVRTQEVLMRRRSAFAACILIAASTAPAEQTPPAPLFDGMGKHRHRVQTISKQAQRYFDQGLVLAWGFNHAEAGRSFREAARLDPSCAMAWWGAAYVLGPNINVPMNPDDAPAAVEAVQKALQLASDPRERAYAEAMATRYAVPPPEDRRPLDLAYADAMRALVKQFPDDLDAHTLLAEALMDLRPWKLWSKTGEPAPETPEILAALERVLAKSPEHPGAIHFYIHSTEASPHPEKAEPYADRLRNLVPGAGHLVHMPGHTYMRVGRYRDVVLANQRATAVDEAYVAQCHAQGVYPIGYVPHNHQFLWAGACMLGQRAVALQAAGTTVAHTAHEMASDPGMGMMQHYGMTPLYAYTRFGMWDEILRSPAPPAEQLYARGVWHYARGLAHARQDRAATARFELASLSQIASRDTLAAITTFEINTAKAILAVAVSVLEGEIAAAGSDWEVAIPALRRAVALEDALNYNEPADWFFPVRHTLGAVLLEAGRATEAETVYREDLKKYPENGWALCGLAKSLAAQNRNGEAAAVQRRFEKAWADADIQISRSRL